MRKISGERDAINVKVHQAVVETIAIIFQVRENLAVG